MHAFDGLICRFEPSDHDRRYLFDALLLLGARSPRHISFPKLACAGCECTGERDLISLAATQSALNFPDGDVQWMHALALNRPLLFTFAIAHAPQSHNSRCEDLGLVDFLLVIGLLAHTSGTTS